MPGYAVSAVYSQASAFSGAGTQPTPNVANFVIYNGGFAAGSSTEYWNILEIMQRGSQVWIWWNGLLIPPSPGLSAELPTSVQIGTPYFPINNIPTGKFGLRMFPGCSVRRVTLRTSTRLFSEMTLGQLELA